MRESIVVRIDTEVPARLWSGIGALFVPADDVEPEDSLYDGGGALVSVPDFQQLIGGTAERLDLSVSGVGYETQALALEESASVSGATVDIGTIRFDDDWQPIGNVVWEARYRADTLLVGDQETDTGRSLTITLSIASEETNRSRAPIALFTDADQRRRSPTDSFYSNQAGISQGTSRRFGVSDG